LIGFRDKRRLHSKLQTSPTPSILRPTETVLLGTGYRARRLGKKKLEGWGYEAEKELSRYPQPSGYNTRTWQTDRRTDRHRAIAKTSLTH